MEKLKKVLFTRHPQNGSSRGCLISLVGGYLIYMAFQMLHNTQSGLSDMSLKTTAVWMGIMILCGLVIIAYGITIVYNSWKDQQNKISEAESLPENREEKSKMKIYSVYDKEFVPYGRVIEGYDLAQLLETLDAISPLPEKGTQYVASNETLEALPVAGLFASNEYGGMPIQLGWCNGHNTRLNCLEYHRDSEVNLGTTDFILLLAKMDDIENGLLDTARVKAFRCPAGVPVEVFGTSLHYAPCSAAPGAGFKVLVILPRGTNGPKPEIAPLNAEDKLLWACNKWLLAHPESNEAAKGAQCALIGENIDIATDL